ncbi:MAG TPA: hypothetical protein VFG54_11480 [Prolixibacteraceae bacterium]|nr:hypothetical protein [Prolixibacteraceae bacterium]
MSKHSFIPMFLIVVLSVFMSCNNPGSDQTVNTATFDIGAARAAIDSANQKFSELFNSGDSVGLANMFTNDAKSMEPNLPSHIGRSMIQRHYSIIMKEGANKLDIKTTGLWGDENMLAEEGEFSFLSADNKELDKGKYIAL